MRFPLAADLGDAGAGCRHRHARVRSSSAWTAKTGVLQGAFIPLVTEPLKETDLAFNVLATSVLGSIAAAVLSSRGLAAAAAQVRTGQRGRIARREPPAATAVPRLPPALRDLQGAFKPPGAELGGPDRRQRRRRTGSYEARVMQGIWAAAPYLHNGSVPTLAELLKPAAAAGQGVQGRPGLRHGQCRPRGRADPVRLYPDHDRLQRPQLGQQPLRPRIRHSADRPGEEGAPRIPEDAIDLIPSG